MNIYDKCFIKYGFYKNMIGLIVDIKHNTVEVRFENSETFVFFYKESVEVL